MIKIGSVYYNDRYFGQGKQIFKAAHVQDVDILIFWGGGDISPHIYGEPNVASYGEGGGHRDAIEVDVMQEALRLQKPILGICRGAQLACAVLGGKLYQHVDRHTSAHDMVIAEPYRDLAHDSTIRTSSLHHQMMIPTAEMEIIATAPGRSRCRENAEGVVYGDHNDPEVVYHAQKRVLMVQGHPEYTPQTSALTVFTKNLVQTLLGIKFQ